MPDKKPVIDDMADNGLLLSSGALTTKQSQCESQVQSQLFMFITQLWGLSVFFCAGYQPIKVALIQPILNDTVFLKFALGKGFCNGRCHFSSMLLHSLECADDTGIAAVKKDVSTMEAALKKLSQQEEKYTAELNDALQQYAELKSQAAEFDPDELQDEKLALRPVMERSAVDRVQSAYGNKYDSLMMYDSKRDVANLLLEEAEARSVREFLRKQHKLHGHERQRKMKHDRER